MSLPLWLIAGREFRAYTATASFWVALAIGPLAMSGVLGLAHLAGHADAPVRVKIEAADRGLARSAGDALAEAARIEGAHLVVVPAGDAARSTRLTVARSPGGDVDVQAAGPLPLSPSGRALVARTIERDEARSRSGEIGAPPASAVVRMASTAAAPRGPDASAITRFAMVMMLWLTLTGSLGMLLQAVVRERANRALESLLAAARPIEIVFGKLLGVGGVSLLVLASWLGSAVALAPMAPETGGLTSTVMHGLADPLALARAGAIYILGFVFYGLITVTLGSAARDSAAAQNLSRPMFAILLAAFFAALVGAGGGSQLSWLVFAPPFTPFMMLLQPPNAMAIGDQLLALAILTVAIVIVSRVAIGSLGITPATIRWPILRAGAAPTAN